MTRDLLRPATFVGFATLLRPATRCDLRLGVTCDLMRLSILGDLTIPCDCSTYATAALTASASVPAPIGPVGCPPHRARGDEHKVSLTGTAANHPLSPLAAQHARLGLRPVRWW